MATRSGRALNRERIVTAAIALADTEGLEAVSMRRVAKELGSGVMSLYRHVTDKDELLREMMEAIHQRHAHPEPGDLGWRERIHLMARHDWDMYMAHPWMLTTAATLAPPAGPHMLASMERTLRALAPLGLTPAAAGRAVLNITYAVQGSARLALGSGSEPGGGPGEAWQQRLAGEDLSAYPRLAELVGSFTGDSDWVTAGLDTVLDGIAAQARKG